jgi:hypothetical protein
LTPSPRRVTELPESFPDVRALCGSRTVAALEEPSDCPWDREMRAVLSLLPATLRRLSEMPLWPRLPETPWLG